MTLEVENIAQTKVSGASSGIEVETIAVVALKAAVNL